MQIIMLSGKARVGKTYLAQKIAEYSFNMGQLPVLLSLADGIKDAALEQGLTKEEHPKEYREFCQKYGVEKRKEDPDYWVGVLRNKINAQRVQEVEALEQDHPHWERVIIIDDVRFMNEVAFGRECGATQIFISSGTRTLIDSDAEWRNHESETLANNVEAEEKDYEEIFQYLIVNEGNQEEFLDSVEPWIGVWCGIENPNLGTDEDCSCAICTARRSGEPAAKYEVMDDFLRLLIEALEEDEDEDTK